MQNNPNQLKFCLFSECFCQKPHVHTCKVCGKKDAHRSADCKQDKKCPALGCIHPPDWPHVHKCDNCPDNTHSSKVSCPNGLRGIIAKVVVDAVKQSIDEARKNIKPAAAGKC